MSLLSSKSFLNEIISITNPELSFDLSSEEKNCKNRNLSPSTFFSNNTTSSKLQI